LILIGKIEVIAGAELRAGAPRYFGTVMEFLWREAEVFMLCIYFGRRVVFDQTPKARRNHAPAERAHDFGGWVVF
jgi:hypothetical protein